jgi:hypothetical protein
MISKNYDECPRCQNCLSELRKACQFVAPMKEADDGSRLCNGSINKATRTWSALGTLWTFSASAMSIAFTNSVAAIRLRPLFFSRSLSRMGCSENLAPHAMTADNSAGCSGSCESKMRFKLDCTDWEICSVLVMCRGKDECRRCRN